MKIYVEPNGTAASLFDDDGNLIMCYDTDQVFEFALSRLDIKIEYNLEIMPPDPERWEDAYKTEAELREGNRRR